MASASAICGTRRGFTKLATSMRRIPASTARRMNSSFTAVGTEAASFCRPSRGPTSTMPMLRGLVIARDCIRKGPRRFRAAALVAFQLDVRSARRGSTRGLATPRVLPFAAAAAVNAFFASADFLLFASEMPSSMLTSSARFRLPLVTARCAASLALA